MECKVCGHKHDIYNHENMEMTHKDTEDFVKIKGHFVGEYGSIYDRMVREVFLYGCPECGTIRFEC